MNRSILIVICDFLLVSLIAFSDFDAMNGVTEKPNRVVAETPAIKTGNAATPQQDLMGTLQTALEDERRTREELNRELSQTREASQGAVGQLQENLRRTETEARQLAQERATLQSQILAARTNLQSLQGALSASSSEARLARQQLETLQAELRKRETESTALRQRMTELERTAQAATAERQTLHSRLQVAETEKRLTGEQLNAMKSEVQTVRAEKAQLQANTAKLAEGVSTLAEKSGQLTQEIRENRPLAPNTIFNDFTQNRVELRLDGVRAGAFNQDVRKDKNAQTILVTDGTQVYALCHSADTPLTPWPPGAEWRSLTGLISRGLSSFPVSRLSFLAQDPRLVVVPLDATQAKQLGARLYKIAPDPFKFQEAVLVGTTENYYGECKFQIDMSTPQYVRMDRSLFRGLIGKFNPSRGDLVLSKTGEVLGVMVNNDYCAVLNRISPAATVQLGDSLRAQQTSQLLSQLQGRVLTLPMKLQ